MRRRAGPGLPSRFPPAVTAGCHPRKGAPMQRDIFTPEHDAFRDMVRTFIAREVAPYHERWERDGVVSRDVWLAAGRAGLLGIEIDEKYGGGGDPDHHHPQLPLEAPAGAGPPAAAGAAGDAHNTEH